MFAALKDIIAVIGAVIILAYSAEQSQWLTKQIAVVRQVALYGARQDWGCPSIFDKRACHHITGSE